MISSSRAFRQARDFNGKLEHELSTERSLQISGRVCYPLSLQCSLGLIEAITKLELVISVNRRGVGDTVDSAPALRSEGPFCLQFESRHKRPCLTDCQKA
ncbi:hypothetical protein PoB_003150900 [Plakobranchus ocellatus]|uniref:Uncharacterized protein n=1 Tax=Plakobranchus ocellatus TaxID=259542 RepID=A0AAV4AEZ9_9GAST|nr:hypothetical protein PoB_003150900 [Plakobranchus ocellatus]